MTEVGDYGRNCSDSRRWTRRGTLTNDENEAAPGGRVANPPLRQASQMSCRRSLNTYFQRVTVQTRVRRTVTRVRRGRRSLPRGGAVVGETVRPECPDASSPPTPFALRCPDAFVGVYRREPARRSPWVGSTSALRDKVDGAPFDTRLAEAAALLRVNGLRGPLSSEQLLSRVVKTALATGGELSAARFPLIPTFSRQGRRGKSLRLPRPRFDVLIRALTGWLSCSR